LSKKISALQYKGSAAERKSTFLLGEFNTFQPPASSSARANGVSHAVHRSIGRF
jgi:hypothetical protein